MASADQLELRPTLREQQVGGKKLAIVGMGYIGPLGNGLQTATDNLVNGVDGISYVESFGFPQIGVHLAGQVKDFDSEARLRKLYKPDGSSPQSNLDASILTKTELRYHSRVLQLGVAASFEGLLQAGLIKEVTEKEGNREVKRWRIDTDKHDPEDIYVIAATGVGGMVEASSKARHDLDSGKHSDTTDIFHGLPARLAATVSMAYGTQGGFHQTSSECASGALALDQAKSIIERGKKKVVIVVSAETVGAEAVDMFDVNTTLSKRTSPDEAPRGFDDDNSGFVPGEMASVMVFVNEDYAREKAMDVHSYLVGTGVSSDSFHQSSPRPDGRLQKKAMRDAIEDAGGLGDGEIYWGAHATGTKGNADNIEAGVIYEVLGDTLNQLAGMSTIKPSQGHGLGAATNGEAVLTLEAGFKRGALPPTIKSRNPSEIATKTKLVRNEARPVRGLRYIGKNGFGFGGTNGTVLFEAAR